MSPQIIIRCIPVFCLLTGLIISPHAGAELFTHHYENVLGTALELRIEADSPAAAEAAHERVLAEIRRLQGVLSAYDRQSEFSRWQAGSLGYSELSVAMKEVLAASGKWNQSSGGAFNPAVESAIGLWRAAASSGVTPSPEALEAVQTAIKAVDWQRAPGIWQGSGLPVPHLTLDGLAKGYIIDQACAAGLGGAEEVGGILVNIGGDMRASGDISADAGIANPGADLDLSPSMTKVSLHNNAIATSGGHQRYFEVGGKKFSHIMNPMTAQPVDHIASATVLAPKAADADALATALCVLPATEGVLLIQSLPNTACLIVEANGATARSENWDQLAQATEPPPAAAETVALAERAYELDIKFEIAAPEGGKEYRRPYVAIWICDDEGYPVRTLLLWYQRGGLRWLPSLRAWMRDDQIRYFTEEMDLAITMSRATRPPGQYDVRWDGKDDHGEPVAPGRYTLFIEAAREHGTHQTIKEQFDLTAEPFTRKLEGNVEIKSVELTFRSRAKQEPTAQ